jgi:hypothetical protein
MMFGTESYIKGMFNFCIFILIFILIDIRARVGKDWKILARELGYSEVGGLFAVEDDGNPAWEDIEYEEENAGSAPPLTL